MTVINQITKEIESYKSQETEICEGYTYSEYKVKRRVMLYKNGIYPTGKFDSQGNYKYYFDIVSPRVSNEIKNIDFDTKDIILASEARKDAGRLILANKKLQNYLHDSGEAEKLNESVERGTEWGNVVYKKLKDGYKLMDLNNFMVLNQSAESLNESDVIEYECLSPVDLRSKKEAWKNVDELLMAGKKDEKKTAPEYYIYERNGEVTTKDYWEAKGEQKGDENEYILAKVIVGGVEKESPNTLLFCEEMDEKSYKEYHRGRYNGRWMRQGLYEILFDIQTRANEIGNQIARGLDWSSKTIFRSSDKVIAQNILTDLQNGDIIKSADLAQVNTRMEGIDQLIADWNRLMQLADALSNSYEVISGENMPAGTPFQLGNLLNVNANKLFDFIREKFSIVFGEVINDWILPEVLKDLKSTKLMKLTADDTDLATYYQMLVDDWYIRNLIALPPHGPEMATLLKQQKLQELMEKKELIIDLEREMWDGFKPRAKVVITGENYGLVSDLETLKSFIQLEMSPIRRTALIEMAMQRKGIDISKLPKDEPNQAPTNMRAGLAGLSGEMAQQESAIGRG